MTSAPTSKAPANVKYMAPQNTIRNMVDRPDGIKISDAIKRAEAKIEAYKETGLAAIDEKIAEMQTLCASLKAGSSAPDERKIYLLANDVFAAAALYNQMELSEAAYSLCDLLGNRAENIPLVWDAINVHVASMRLLRQAPDHAEAEQRQHVLAGLKQVTARLIAEASKG
ncbi:MAG: hypothetical protein ABWZ40_02210 [Caulobacterales bacterium]